MMQHRLLGSDIEVEPVRTTTMAGAPAEVPTLVRDDHDGQIWRMPDGQYLAFNSSGHLVAGRDTFSEAAIELAWHARALDCLHGLVDAAAR